jgi:hypothetical protein
LTWSEIFKYLYLQKLLGLDWFKSKAILDQRNELKIALKALWHSFTSRQTLARNREFGGMGS